VCRDTDKIYGNDANGVTTGERITANCQEIPDSTPRFSPATTSTAYPDMVVKQYKTWASYPTATLEVANAKKLKETWGTDFTLAEI